MTQSDLVPRFNHRPTVDRRIAKVGVDVVIEGRVLASTTVGRAPVLIRETPGALRHAQKPRPPHLRWSNWATEDEGRTGEALLDFVNIALLPRLKNLTGGGDKIATLIRTAFEDANCGRATVSATSRSAIRGRWWSTAGRRSLWCPGVANNAACATPVTLVVSVTDAHLDQVQIALNGASFNSGTLVSSDARYTLFVAATDLAGNRATALVAFEIDTRPPALSFSFPAEGAVIGSTSVVDLPDLRQRAHL